MLILPKSDIIPYGLFEGPTTIDWSKSHAQGLVCYVKVGPGNEARDLVYGVPLALQNGATMVSTPKGRMLNCQAANRGAQGTATSGQFNFANARCSILVSGIYRGAPSANTRYAGISYDSSTVSPYDIITIEPVNDFGNYYGEPGWNNNGAFTVGPGRSGSTTPFISVTDAYFHACGSIASGNQQMYNNGIPGVGGNSAITAILAGTAPQIIFGTYPGQTFNANVDLETLMIWNREVTQTEFRDLWYYGPQLVLKQERKYFIASGFQAAPIQLGATVQSISEIRAGLGVERPLSSQIYSISEVKAPTLSKTFDFNSVKVESASEIKQAVLGNTVILSAFVESASQIVNNLVNPKEMSAQIYSISEIQTGLSRIIVGGIYSLSTIVVMNSPTSYMKGAPRPIAYLKNDNDTFGATNESPVSSPSDYDFP